jgi:glycerol kinase
MKYVLALIRGRPLRAVLFDQHAAVKASCAVAFDQHYPKPGWFRTGAGYFKFQLEAMRGAIRRSGVDAADICAVGISNQRETAWRGMRARRALCGRHCLAVPPYCAALSGADAGGHGERIREKTGLLPDAYFSGTKFAWMLANEPGVKQAAQAGTLRFGTVDSFLIWHLTGGKTYVTDPSNASRTMLMNLNTCSWDDELLALLGIKREYLPRIVDTSGVVGQMDAAILGREIPIAALAGDQQAALFGQGCIERGMVKNTYGTGCFVLMQTGETPVGRKTGC